MQTRCRIQATGQNNGDKLRNYTKSSNRSENRPLICANDPVLFWLDTNWGRGELKNADMKIRENSSDDLYYIHRSPIDTGDFWKTVKDNMEK